MGYTSQTGSEQGEDRPHLECVAFNVATEQTNINVDQLGVLGHMHLLSDLSPSTGVPKQRLKLRKMGLLFQEEQGREGVHISPCPREPHHD